MGMGFAPTWLRQVSPPAPASQNHFNHCMAGAILRPNLDFNPISTNTNPKPNPNNPNHNHTPKTENSLEQIQLSVPGYGK